MGYIPSIRLSDAFEVASTGIYLEQMQDERVGLVCKIPDNAIKAIHRGAKCSLFVGVVQAESLPLLCFGFRIHDEPEHPFTLFHLDSFPETVPLLNSMLTSATATLHCVNELNHPMLAASCSLASEVARTTSVSFSQSEHWLLTPETSKRIKMEDLRHIFEVGIEQFSQHVYRSPGAPRGKYVNPYAHIDLTLDIWKPTEIFDATPTAHDGPFLIGDENEGTKFERLLHLTIDYAYPGSSYRSPSVQDGKYLRELTDVLAFDENSICVIQAKALAALSVDAQRSSTRLTNNVTKDIRKGLGQLGGALGNIRSGVKLSRAGGEPLEIPNRERSLAHAIVLLSEMYAFVDWQKVAEDVIQASDNELHKAMFHVMDMRELAALTARCPDGSAFFNRLCQRWINVKIKGTGYIRSVVPRTQ
jgi:hypothetical protein